MFTAYVKLAIEWQNALQMTEVARDQLFRRWKRKVGAESLGMILVALLVGVIWDVIVWDTLLRTIVS
jgi:hypothetical protein